MRALEHVLVWPLLAIVFGLATDHPLAIYLSPIAALPGLYDVYREALIHRQASKREAQ